MKTSTAVLLVATMDTKGEEALFLEERLKRSEIPVLIMDAGIRGESPHPVAIGRREVAEAAGKTLEEVRRITEEGDALNVMIKGAVPLALELFEQGKIGGVLGLGGSMGTTLGTAVMRRFPLGFPKVMVSTMASRDTSAFVGTKDILMLHSVCDLSGLNRISRMVLSNGAAAISGMVLFGRASSPVRKPLLCLSTLGTTEFCAQKLREHFEKNGYEVIVFHTVGAGGKAMEEIIMEGDVEVVVDLSLHEMADHRFGGDYDAGPERGWAALRKGVPTVLVPGYIDFLVTGALATTLKRFPNRSYHAHNAAITVVRTDRKEVQILAEEIAGICNGAAGPWTVLVPLKGLSAFDAAGGTMHDAEGPLIVFQSLRKGVHKTSSVRLLPCHINDPTFADAIIEAAESLRRPPPL